MIVVQFEPFLGCLFDSFLVVLHRGDFRIGSESVLSSAYQRWHCARRTYCTAVRESHLYVAGSCRVTGMSQHSSGSSMRSNSSAVSLFHVSH
jgi:hypothetical protein